MTGKQNTQKKTTKENDSNDSRKESNIDARFKRIRNEEHKIVVDDRFKDMFTHPSFTSDYKVDKYGQKTKISTADDLKKYYQIENENEDENEEKNEENEEEIVEKKSEKKNTRQLLKEKLKNKKTQNSKASGIKAKVQAKAAKAAIESSDESSDDDEDDEYDDEDDFEEEEKEEIEDGDETKRVALVNLDWDNIKAVDILVALNSFLPTAETNAYIKKVSIIPSLFGLEQIEIEEREGPQGLWDEKDKDEENENNDKGEEGDEEEENNEKEEEGEKDEDEKEDDDDDDDDENRDSSEFNKEKLRKYQLKRMKYYFAVVEFDSKETALHVYRQCDGVEMDRTSNKFDLRFIPDDVTFTDKQIPRDEATEVPVDYKSPRFYTSALQHSNVKLTWDDDDQDRIQITRKGKFTKDQLNEMDFRAYLASSSSDESEVEQEEELKKKKKKKKVRAKYKSLLEESLPQQEFQEDMEVTFTPGLSKNIEEAVNRTLNSKNDTSVWDEYLRKRAEKKKQRKKERKQKEEEEKEEEEAKGKGGKKTKEDEEREKAELELLLLNRNNKSKKSKDKDGDDSKKGKKGKGKKGEEDDDFFFDVKDSRFDAMFTKLKDFDIDPTDPRFKKTSATKQIINERLERFENRKANASNTSDKSNVDVKSLVNSIKRKTNERQQIQNQQEQAFKKRKLE